MSDVKLTYIIYSPDSVQEGRWDLTQAEFRSAAEDSAYRPAPNRLTSRV